MTWSTEWLSGRVASSQPAAAWQPATLEEQVAILSMPEPAVSAQQLHEQELLGAYEQGRAAGLAEGHEVAAALLETAFVALQDARDQFETLREPWLRDAHAHVAALAVAAARHVIEREVRSEPTIIADLVRRVLAEFPLDDAVRIRIHPEDLSAISTTRAAGELRLAPGRQVEWVADDEIGIGGCVVEGPRRVVDGRVASVLQRIYEALTHE